jgi:hypothetical protein
MPGYHDAVNISSGNPQKKPCTSKEKAPQQHHCWDAENDESIFRGYHHSVRHRDSTRQGNTEGSGRRLEL